MQVGDPGTPAEPVAKGRRQADTGAGKPQPLRADGSVGDSDAAHRHVCPGHQQGHQCDRGHQRLLHLHLPR